MSYMTFELPEISFGEELFTYPNSEGFCHEIDAVGEAFLSGKTEVPELPHKISLNTAHIMETIWRQNINSFKNNRDWYDYFSNATENL